MTGSSAKYVGFVRKGYHLLKRAMIVGLETGRLPLWEGNCNIIIPSFIQPDNIPY